ncbi:MULTISPECIES: BON domain-containing protein [unclassified Anabaena]|uniref:BON domain-containing protein n=1 Tax=unclassified Anabaena TaxID=2619674 RepID=UPI0039C65F5D
MKKLTPFLISCALFFGVAACNDTARTDSAAPDTSEAPAAPTAQTTQESREDATSDTRRRQLDADIRAREERTAALDQAPGERNPEDLASEVRSKLEANIPGGLLTVEANDEGVVTVSGTVPDQDQLSKIEPLAKEIYGVNNVVVDAVVTPPQG